MDCVCCGCKTVAYSSVFRIEHDDIKLTIKDIPAYRCTCCKEVYYEFHIACRILNVPKVYLKRPAGRRPDLISYQRLPRKRLWQISQIFKPKKDIAKTYRISEL